MGRCVLRMPRPVDKLKFVRITRVSENELRLEDIFKGVVGRSHALERILSKLKRRGCIIRRTGYGGLAYAQGTSKLVQHWNDSGFKIGNSMESS